MADRPVFGYPSGRSAVMAPGGMVATSQPLASLAGTQVLMAGGSAVDAAVAAAAVLCVVEPPMTGLGGDLQAMVYDPGRDQIRGLNASGRAPAAATIDRYRSLGHTRVPEKGPLSVTVPGAVDGWFQLWKAYGRLPFRQLLEPAIRYARSGFPVSPVVAAQWRRFARFLRPYPDALSTFLPEGLAPRPGQRVRLPGLACTLEGIAVGGRASFYEGALARRISESVRRAGGLLTEEDMMAHLSEWVEPVSTAYKGYHLFEIPPNTQGLVALQILKLLEGMDLAALGHNSGEYLHRLVEAKKLAFADRDAYLGDPARGQIPVTKLLEDGYLAARRALIDSERASVEVHPGLEHDGDTVLITVADQDRMLVSMMQSVYQPFGSGVVAGDTGVLLHNRGAFFTLDPDSPNRMEPGKRPLHTLIPAIAFAEGRPWMAFGVMGGDNQPQAQVQVLLNLIEFGMDVQEAGEAPRFRHLTGPAGGELMVESGIRSEAVISLLEKGHRVTRALDVFGGYQAVMIDHAHNILMGGSDPRKDGAAVGY